jgi:hypothetical protein
LGEDQFLVDLKADPLQGADPQNVLAHQHAQFLALTLCAKLVSAGLQPDPEAVCFLEVVEDDGDGVLIGLLLSLELAAPVRQPILAGLQKIVSDKQTPQRILNSLQHLNQVVQHPIKTLLVRLDVDCPHRDQQV